MKKRLLITALALCMLLISALPITALAAEENWVVDKTMPGEPYYYFRTPTALDFDAAGNIYTVESGVEGGAYWRIKKYSATGILDTTWGGGDGIIGVGPPAAFDIAVSPAGELFVPDNIDFSIKKYNTSGELDTSWGSGGSVSTYGAGNTAFGEAHGIDLDGAGNIYVRDGGGDRAIKLDANGDLDTTWAGGNGYVDISGRYGSLTVSASGVLYVVDSDNYRVMKFTAAGVLDTTWGGGDGVVGTGSEGAGPDEFNTPVGASLKSDGSLYVSDPKNGRIKRFDANGVLDTTWGGGDGMLDGAGDTKYFEFPYGLETDASNNLYVVDMGGGRFYRFTDNGLLDTTWLEDGMLRCSYGSEPERFQSVTAISADEERNVLYVADAGNNRIKRILADGSPDTSWGGGDGTIGSLGTGDDDFDSPTGVAVTADGRFYVADSGNYRIKKYLPDGSLDTSWGGGDGIISNADTDPVPYNRPNSLALDADENLYVTEWGLHRVKRYTPDGSLDTSWAGGDGIIDSWVLGSSPTSLTNPTGITVGPDGRLYVADIGNDRVICFDADGDIDFGWGGDSDGIISTFDAGTDQLRNPGGVALDYAGNLYVADTSNDRIVRFDENGVLDTTWFADGVWEEPGTYDDTDQPYDNVKGIAFHKGMLYSGWSDRMLILRDTANTYDGIAGLSDLKADGETVGGFSEDNADYTVTVPYGRDYVRIDATGNSYIKKVAGTGYFALGDGDSTFQVVATAVDNSTKAYTVTVKRGSPYAAAIDGDSLTIGGLTVSVPEGGKTVILSITLDDGSVAEFPISLSSAWRRSYSEEAAEETEEETEPVAEETQPEEVEAEATPPDSGEEATPPDTGDEAAADDFADIAADDAVDVAAQPGVFPWWWIVVGVLGMGCIGLGAWVLLLRRK